MRHILTTGGNSLRAPVLWDAPNLVCISRAKKPPVPSLSSGDETDETDEKKAVGDEPTAGTKKEIRGISTKSKLAIARVLSSLDWAKLGPCVHFTLTYWNEFPAGKEALAAEKQRICMGLLRLGLCCVWRLEFQRRVVRGFRVPHFHVLAWCGPLPRVEVVDSVRSWWRSANPHDEGCHASAGDGRSAWYLAMHAAKDEQAPKFAVGRWWGFVDRARVLAAQDLQRGRELSERERVWWARLYRRCSGCRTRNEGGFNWFLPRSEKFKAELWVAGQVEREQLDCAGNLERRIGRWSDFRKSPEAVTSWG